VTTVGSLCTGYGGLDLGLELALGVPLRHAWHVENDPAPSKILAARFPGVPNLGDLKTLDYGAMEPVDILTAGYPCQPFSDAGLRKGADDPRHLWPYVADTIGALRPGLVLLENVRGHVRRGLDCVVADLAHLGYDAWWGVVPASAAGAPHLRNRVFIAAQDADLAARGERRFAAPGQAQGWRTWADAGGRGGVPTPDATGDGRHEGRAESARQLGRPDVAERGTDAPPHANGGGLAEHPERDSGTLAGGDGGPSQRDDALRRDRAVTDPNGAGLEVGSGLGSDARPELPAAERGGGKDLRWGSYEPAVRRWERITGRLAPWATEPRGRGGAERLSPRFVEWMMGLPAGWVTDVDITINEQLRALGNGVVPQQAALAIRLLQPHANAIGEVA
jgi:DNA (cytosine-5)-methyltransferase 1